MNWPKIWQTFLFTLSLVFSALPCAPAYAHPLTRLVVLDSTLAEIVVALGGAQQIAGTVGGVDHLPELSGTPRLPGYRQQSAESLLALAPDIILAGSDRATPQTLAQLAEAGVRVLELGAEANEQAVEQRIHAIADLLGKKPQGEVLAQQFRHDMRVARDRVALAPSHPKAVFILAGGGRPTVAGGRGTSTAALLEMAGAHNIANTITGYKTLSQESLLMAAPEFILTNAEGLDSTDAHGTPAVLLAPGAAATPAARSGNLITIPGRYLQGFGLFTPQAIRLLAARLHPELP